MNLAKLINTNYDVINKNFGATNLKYSKNRDVVSRRYSKIEVAALANHCKAVQKIMTGNGKNSYIYVAPKGFNDFIDELPSLIRKQDLEQKIEALKLEKQASTTKRKI